MITAVDNSVRVNLSLLSKQQPQNMLDCLIILNVPLGLTFPQLFIPNVKHIICADGGANRLFDSSFKDTPNLKAITGDLDSLKPHVREHYASRNIPIVQDQDQNSNDLQKAITLAMKYNFTTIACLGVLGGRIDQQFCNLNNLQKFGHKYQHHHFIGLGEGSLVYLVKENLRTRIILDQLCIRNQVGLICFGRAKVETQGYKWNLGQKHGLPELNWSQLVSSSNQALGGQVSITTSKPLFATFQFAASGKNEL